MVLNYFISIFNDLVNFLEKKVCQIVLPMLGNDLKSSCSWNTVSCRLLLTYYQEVLWQTRCLDDWKSLKKKKHDLIAQSEQIACWKQAMLPSYKLLNSVNFKSQVKEKIWFTWKEYRKVTTNGCKTFFRMWLSAWMYSECPLSKILVFDITFIAYISPVCRFLTWNTCTRTLNKSVIVSNSKPKSPTIEARNLRV